MTQETGDDTSTQDAGTEEALVHEGAPQADTQSSRLGRWLVPGSAALAAAAVVVAAVFGIMWWVAASGDDVRIAQARHDVSQAAHQAVAILTKLDSEEAEAGFQRQKSVTTGDLHDQLERAEEQASKIITETETKTVSTVQDVAVSELNVHEGKASVLAVVSNQVTQGDQQSTKLLPLEVQMQRVDDDGEQVWKLSSFTLVPYTGAEM